MTTTSGRALHAIKNELDHPVIDADAHWLEPLPVFLDYVATVGGAADADRFRQRFDVEASANALPRTNDWYRASRDERLSKRILRGGFWSFPAETVDFATASLPNLMNERLGELGIDFAVVYPTHCLGAMSEAREDVRRLWCRAYNVMIAEAFAGHHTSMTPAAVIPMHTPEEAVEELTFVTRDLGLKSAVIWGHVVREQPADQVERGRWNKWLDFMAIDSIYDYDPFWAACVEQKVAVTAHGLSVGWPNMASPTSYMFNHIGLFGMANYALCKALVLGGVPRRFPGLRIGFLESGVAWAAQLYADTREHYELRNTEALEKHLSPMNLDIDRFRELWATYADPAWQDKIDAMVKAPWAGPLSGHTTQPTPIDQLAARDAGRNEWEQMGDDDDLRSMFANSFFFGAEAEDRTTAFAFDSPLGFDLSPVLGSDIGHWDVAVMADVMTGAYELVRDGTLTEDQFKAFVYTNPARLYLDQNPTFFDGTVLEDRLGSAVPTKAG